MATRETITIFCSSLNEQKNLKFFLERHKWADEIFIFDSGSTDGSIELCQQYGRKVLHKPLRGDNNARTTYGLNQCVTDWVFLSDPDEILTEKLRDEILMILKKGTEYKAFQNTRVNYFLGRPLRHGGWSGKSLKFFRRDSVSFEGESYHEHPIVKGGIGQLEGELHHYPNPTINWFVQKFNYSSELDCKSYFDTYGEMPKMKFLWMVFYKPFRKWWKSFIWKKGYKDGFHGFIYAALIFAFDMTRICKYAERYILKNPNVHALDDLPDPWACRKH